MRILIALSCGLLAAAGCRRAPSPWRPTPVTGAPQPAQVVTGTTAADWQEIAPDDLLVMELGDGGRVIIQLAPAFAAYVTGRANRSDAFFMQPAGGVDVCNAPVPVRRRP